MMICPHCRMGLNPVRFQGGDEGEMALGDVVVCVYCQWPLVMGEGGLRKITDMDVESLSDDFLRGVGELQQVAVSVMNGKYRGQN